MRPAILIVALSACASAVSVPSEVPVAFGRWRPPEGQSCYVDALRPPELPPVSTLLDSAALTGELRDYPPGEILITLLFDSSGNAERARVIDRRMSARTADSVRATVVSRVRPIRTGEPWGARLYASTGAAARLALARRELCPPALLRIEPLSAGGIPPTEREPELTPSPDWMLRGAGPPAGPARSSVEKAIARTPPRDTASPAVDSTSTAPDAAAIGEDVVTLRVLIDTAGAIAHAQISRGAMAHIDRQRLVAELARYRFSPALEDRVPSAWWVILKIK